MTLKTITEEVRDICTLCGGRGQESSLGQNTAAWSPCRQCQGSGQVLTRVTTRREEVNLDELADALSRRIAQQLKAAPTLWGKAVRIPPTPPHPSMDPGSR